MRKISFVLAIAACAASSLSLAQHRELPADIASPAAVGNAGTEADDDGTIESGTVRDKSGFGQVMSVLTDLLQEAAARQATSGSSNASQLMTSDQSAVTITVTPVAGRTTFFVDQAAADRNSVDRAKPSARVAVTTIDAGAAAPGAQIAMQAKSDVPD